MDSNVEGKSSSKVGSSREAPQEKGFDPRKVSTRRAAEQGINMLIRALQENLAQANDEVVNLHVRAQQHGKGD